jgi:hypothetical protein
MCLASNLVVLCSNENLTQQLKTILAHGKTRGKVREQRTKKYNFRNFLRCTCKLKLEFGRNGSSQWRHHMFHERSGVSRVWQVGHVARAPLERGATERFLLTF